LPGGLISEDIAIQASMGAIVDRTRENVGPLSLSG